MADPLSTDDGEGQSDFDSLEERIVYTERDKEREVRTSVRLAHCHYSQMDRIQRELGTNKVEILNRAYNAGLSELRQIEFVERSNSILDLSNKIGYFVESDFKYWNNGGADMKRHGNYKIDMREDYECLLEQPEKISIQDSVLSEVRDRIEDIMMIKPGVHRPIITVGLSTSGMSTNIIESNAENVLVSFDDALSESRQKMEAQISSGLARLYPVLESEGIDEEHLNILKEVIGLMETEYSRSMRMAVDSIEENCDVL